MKISSQTNPSLQKNLQEIDLITADLHIHSHYSDDGEYSPAELIDMCIKKGIITMSIADHNCVRANKEALDAAKKKGITYIPGIEIDCVYENSNFHILGYNIDYESGDFLEIEQNIRRQNLQASKEMLAKTQALGFTAVSEHDLSSLSRGRYWAESWTGEMFAEVLLSMPEYADHPLLLPYLPGGKRSDNPYVNFYWDYYSQGKPCYVKIEYPSMEKIIDIIHANHGQAVLAHPGVNLKNKENLLEGIIALGIDGIEAYSSYHSPAEAEYFSEKAKIHGLIITCGSDFHGKTKPAIKLGDTDLKNISLYSPTSA